MSSHAKLKHVELRVGHDGMQLTIRPRHIQTDYTAVFSLQRPPKPISMIKRCVHANDERYGGTIVVVYEAGKLSRYRLGDPHHDPLTATTTCR